jgi:2-polyprenyl-3-methyl-5-hydroxy-6-metoxy-1,4-benzoquinol methylase
MAFATHQQVPHIGTSVPHLVPVPRLPIVHGRWEFVINLCCGKNVLHLGCSDAGLTNIRLKSGALLHSRLAQVAAGLWGVDSDERGLQALRAFGFTNLVQADLEGEDWPTRLHGQYFDVIVATELLEHLNNPGLFLQRTGKLFMPGTIMVLSVPNGLRLSGRFKLLHGYEEVNPDHNFWFSYSTITTLLRKNGYGIVDLVGYSYFDHRASLISLLFRPAVNGSLVDKYVKRPVIGTVGWVGL